MAFLPVSRVLETGSGSGTGNVTLQGAQGSGEYDAFSERLSVGDSTFYIVVDGNDFEIGYGTYSAATPSSGTFTRDTVIRSSSGTSKISLSGSDFNIFGDVPPEKMLVVGPTGAVTNVSAVAASVLPKDFASLTALEEPADNTILGVGYGVTEGDGLGGLFRWDDTSTATSDGVHVHQLDALGSSPGRFIRERQSLFLREAASDPSNADEIIRRSDTHDIKSNRSDTGAKTIPEVQNVAHHARYETLAALKAVASSNWKQGDRILLLGISAEGDVAATTGTWQASSTNTDSLDTTFVRPDDISGSNPGRFQFPRDIDTRFLGFADGGTIAASSNVITVEHGKRYQLTASDSIQGVDGLSDGEFVQIIAPATGTATLIDGATPGSGQAFELSGANKEIESTDESVCTLTRVGSAIRLSGGVAEANVISTDTFTSAKALADSAISADDIVDVKNGSSAHDRAGGRFRAVTSGTYDLSSGDVDGLCFATTAGGFQLIREGYAPGLDVNLDWLAPNRAGGADVAALLNSVIVFADDNNAFSVFDESGFEVYCGAGDLRLDSAVNMNVGAENANGLKIRGAGRRACRFILNGNHAGFESIGSTSSNSTNQEVSGCTIQGDGATRLLNQTPTAGASDTFTVTGVNVADATKQGEVFVRVDGAIIDWDDITFANNGADLDVTVTPASGFAGTEDVDIAVFPAATKDQIGIHFAHAGRFRIGDVNYHGLRICRRIEYGFQGTITDNHAWGGDATLPSSDSNWIGQYSSRTNDGSNDINASNISGDTFKDCWYSGMRWVNGQSTRVDNSVYTGGFRAMWHADPSNLPPGITAGSGDNTQFKWLHCSNVLLDSTYRENFYAVKGVYTTADFLQFAPMWLGSSGEAKDSPLVYLEGFEDVEFGNILAKVAPHHGFHLKDCAGVTVTGSIDDFGATTGGTYDAVHLENSNDCKIDIRAVSAGSSANVAVREIGTSNNNEVHVRGSFGVDLLGAASHFSNRNVFVGGDKDGFLVFRQGNVRRAYMGASAFSPFAADYDLGTITIPWDQTYTEDVILVDKTGTTGEKGSIQFNCDDDGGNNQQFARIRVNATVVTNGAEEAQLWFYHHLAGTARLSMSLKKGWPFGGGSVTPTAPLIAADAVGAAPGGAATGSLDVKYVDAAGAVQTATIATY
ncbi:MAG: hypothetical protein AAGC77_06470 [Pseudomonadota bacterium]